MLDNVATIWYDKIGKVCINILRHIRWADSSDYIEIEEEIS